MPAASFVSFSSTNLGIISLAFALLAIAIAAWRRIALPPLSACLMSAGIILLPLAAAEPQWNHPAPGSIAVMVDLSPSTRGANFRNPDFLRRRIEQLIGAAPHQLIGFASQNRSLDAADSLAEMPADRTLFSPPDAGAIILFSDAQFDPPQKSPPVYIAVDPGLENISDAAVQKLELHGQDLTATIFNTGPARQAEFPGSSVQIGNGTLLITRPIPPANSNTTVELNHRDLWPENDSLSLDIPPPTTSEKWWLGKNPDSTWKSFPPTQLPERPEAYLAPSVIVIDNQPASRFSPPALDRLMQYLRDLGGSILILGGDHSFAAGAYPGTTLEQISPLASFPPSPVTRWILLTDASGSMSQDAGGISRWQAATQAIVHLLPALPPADPVLIGQFSDIIKWWLPAESAFAAAKISLPPPDAFPHGPTNLESALQLIATQTEGNLPTVLLLLSDCDARIYHPDDLANQLRQKNIHLYVLAISNGSALESIRKISTTTGGSVIQQFDPHQWTQSIQDLSQAALPLLLMHEPVNILFEAEAKSLPSATTSLWNRTWLRPDAKPWAGTSRGDSTLPMAASWQVGTGIVAATAFEPDPTQIKFLANLIARKPYDSRFTVLWETGSKLHVIVDAVDAEKFLNDLTISLELTGNGENQSIPLHQTAPGRYEVAADSPRTSQIATLATNGEIIDRAAIAGRYAPEFDALGNDHAAMRQLAGNTAGQTIWPTDPGPIHFNWPTVATPLAPWICLLAISSISSGLIVWRFKHANAN